MLKQPPQTVTGCPGGSQPRDHPIPNSIPVRAALKKERVMDKATLKLLEFLALNRYAALTKQRGATLDPVEEADLKGQQGQLRAYLDAFWEELKGDA